MVPLLFSRRLKSRISRTCAHVTFPDTSLPAGIQLLLWLLRLKRGYLPSSSEM